MAKTGQLKLFNRISVKSNNGFSLVEILVVVFILSLMGGGIFMTFQSGQNAWTETDTQIKLQENLRIILGRISRELRESGSDGIGTMQVTINDGGGIGTTDTLVFSMPITCQAGTSVMDASGDVAYWGAPLTWGCTSSTCMDADDDCSTVDYKYVSYQIDSNDQLLRRVLDGGSSVVRQDIFGQNISDFQAEFSPDQNLIILTVTLTENTDFGRVITDVETLVIKLRNRG